MTEGISVNSVIAERDRLRKVNREQLGALRMVWDVFNIDLYRDTNTGAGKCYARLAPIIAEAETERRSQ